MPRTDIHPLLASRWSPRKFADRAIPPEDLRTLFEAARWAPSSFNEQPWAFIVGTPDDPETWDAVLDTMVPFNKEWASGASAVFLTFARERFEKNDESNRHALHDVGQAVAHLTVQATAMDLVVHQMAGFDQDRAQENFDVPEGWIPTTAVAIGYPVEEMPEDRSRKPPEKIIFSGRFGDKAHWLDG